MTKDEMVEIMAIITAAYPRFYDKQTDVDKIAALRLWYRHFMSISYDIMLQAADAVIATNKYPPTIAEINEKIDLLLRDNSENMSETEAWSYVSKAIKNSLYNYENEFNMLPPIVQKIVHNAYQLCEWAGMDESTIQSVVASNFVRAYRSEMENVKQKLSLPKERRKYIERSIKNIGNGSDR